ncbi:hypothetical protein B0H16DRAFT_1825970 [Mycena metata]|uniref:Uncharacterized protein n=1 Tax=Mycena metata TaxID=1033252 RepID=A0AAD7J3V7_9AGAR|nr:hypothetical protein B0H16DRAFT_1825970 [Mycena metata]
MSDSASSSRSASPEPQLEQQQQRQQQPSSRRRDKGRQQQQPRQAQPQAQQLQQPMQQAAQQVAPQGGGGGKDALKLRLDLNLDVDVQIKARVHGDVTLSLMIRISFRIGARSATPGGPTLPRRVAGCRVTDPASLKLILIFRMIRTDSKVRGPIFRWCAASSARKPKPYTLSREPNSERQVGTHGVFDRGWDTAPFGTWIGIKSLALVWMSHADMGFE